MRRLRNPWVWVSLVLILLIVIVAIAFLFDSEDSDDQAQRPPDNTPTYVSDNPRLCKGSRIVVDGDATKPTWDGYVTISGRAICLPDGAQVIAVYHAYDSAHSAPDITGRFYKIRQNPVAIDDETGDFGLAVVIPRSAMPPDTIGSIELMVATGQAKKILADQPPAPDYFSRLPLGATRSFIRDA